MHPLVYRQGQDRALAELRQTARTVRMIFAGNVTAATCSFSASQRALGERFGLINLLKTVRMAPELDSATIAEMRRNVIEHYDRYLSPESFRQRLACLTAPEVPLFINTERKEVFESVTPASLLFGRQSDEPLFANGTKAAVYADRLFQTGILQQSFNSEICESLSRGCYLTFHLVQCAEFVRGHVTSTVYLLCLAEPLSRQERLEGV